MKCTESERLPRLLDNGDYCSCETCLAHGLSRLVVHRAENDPAWKPEEQGFEEIRGFFVLVRDDDEDDWSF